MSSLPVVQMLLGLDGGKGGFGSLLRALGKNIGLKTDNVEACRDINGRRLRHVNSEKKLIEWYAMEDERKLEAELEKKKRKAVYLFHRRWNLHLSLRVVGSSI